MHSFLSISNEWGIGLQAGMTKMNEACPQVSDCPVTAFQ